jgi:hypothetical protein
MPNICKWPNICDCPETGRVMIALKQEMEKYIP